MNTQQMNIIRNQDIIIVGQQPWDTTIGSNCKNIALEFSKHNRVLYVNAPLDRITSLRDRREASTQARQRVIKRQVDSLSAESQNLWVFNPDQIIESINWLPDNFLYDLLNRWNNKTFSRSILKAISTLGFKDYILFNDNDILRSFYLKEFLKPAVSVYYNRDNMQAVPYWQKHGKRLEPKLIAKSDVCLANSDFLASFCQRFNVCAYNVEQGCDLDFALHAETMKCPPALKDIKKPIIGYVGALVDLRLDIELLEHISTTRPDWSIVLAGPEDEAFKASRLHQLPNVHFIGQTAVNELGAYLNNFDVCINPQRINQMTIGNYPRKIDEYLAMGKPVVATRTKAMEAFAPCTYLAETMADYITLIDLALKEDSPALQAARKAFAATHTWENSVAKIYKAILSSTSLSKAQRDKMLGKEAFCI